MELRLSRGEYWLLNSVVEHATPIAFLKGSDPLHLFNFNKTGHGLSREHLVATLCDLFHRGWITAAVRAMDSDVEPQEVGKLSSEAIVSALDGPQPISRQPCIYYRLTPEGASVWQSFASPEWDLFIDTTTGEFVGTTEWRVRKFFDLIHYLGIAVIPASVIWDEVRPWKATYWKTLPVGYRVRFEYEEREMPEPFWENVPHEIVFLQRWYDWV